MTRLFQLVAADAGLFMELDIGDGPQRLEIHSNLPDMSVWNHTVQEVWRRLRENPPHSRKHTQYEYKVVDPKKMHRGDLSVINQLNELSAVGWKLCHHPYSHDIWYLRRERHE